MRCRRWLGNREACGAAQLRRDALGHDDSQACNPQRSKHDDGHYDGGELQSRHVSVCTDAGAGHKTGNGAEQQLGLPQVSATPGPQREAQAPEDIVESGGVIC